MLLLLDFMNTDSDATRDTKETLMMKLTLVKIFDSQDTESD